MTLAYYPKRRDLMTLVIPINRTDNGTRKCMLPKDAVVVNVHVFQTSAAVTGNGSFSLGWAGATTALINAFSMPTTSVGLVNAGANTGTGVMTKLTEDKNVISTYSVGTSTGGGEGYVIIDFFVAGAGEAVTG